MKTIYKAETYFLEITSIEIEFETDSFYREVGRGHKRAKNGPGYKSFNPDFRSEFNGAFGNYFFTKEIAIENYNSQMMFNEVNHTFVEAELEGIVYYRYIGTNIWD